MAKDFFVAKRCLAMHRWQATRGCQHGGNTSLCSINILSCQARGMVFNNYKNGQHDLTGGFASTDILPRAIGEAVTRLSLPSCLPVHAQSI